VGVCALRNTRSDTGETVPPWLLPNGYAKSADDDFLVSLFEQKSVFALATEKLITVSDGDRCKGMLKKDQNFVLNILETCLMSLWHLELPSISCPDRSHLLGFPRNRSLQQLLPNNCPKHS
jgi:hypothetical protein